MSDQGEHKNKSALSPREAADTLRQLAEQLERGTLVLDGQQVSMDHALVLEQSVKAEEGGLSYRLKLKYKTAATHGGPEPTSPGAPMEPAPATGGSGQAPSFKVMKKALGGLFKQIQAVVKQGGLPSAQLAQDLLELCGQLLDLPQGGGQGFHELRQQAQLLLQAVEKGDPALAGQAAQALGRIKSACHAAGK
jgi:XXXCH domain-containing protein